MDKTYLDLEWEDSPTEVYRLLLSENGIKEIPNIHEIQFKFDESLNRKPCFRHPLPQEFFGLMFDILEGVYLEELIKTRENIEQTNKEWLSLAFERNGDILTAYLNPRNIIFDLEKMNILENNLGYVPNGGKLIHTGEYKFNIKGLESKSWVKVTSLGDEFSQLIYGKPLEDLLEYVAAGKIAMPELYLPPEGILSPISTSTRNSPGIKGRFNLADYGLSGSRLVRPRLLV